MEKVSNRKDIRGIKKISWKKKECEAIRGRPARTQESKSESQETKLTKLREKVLKYSKYKKGRTGEKYLQANIVHQK